MIDDYIASAAPAARPVLKEIKKIVKRTVPGAQETISYRMPAFKKGRVFIYFAAFKNHIGIYPPAQVSATLETQLQKYRGPKGNLRFPLDEPMPYELITRVVEALAKQYAKEK